MTSHLQSSPTECPSRISVQVDPVTGYFTNIDEIRQIEYPSLQDTTYLDHAGTTAFAKSLIELHAKELTGSLFGNPHSASTSSQLSSQRIDDTRFQVLRFFNASPEHFEVVFVANATAGIKLVAEAFRDHDSGFWYGYHADSHTSVVGVRELAMNGSRCLQNDDEVETWIAGLEQAEISNIKLFAYPGQSNMTGYRSPLTWCRNIRKASSSLRRRVYTLFDAAGLVSTSPLSLDNPSAAPDFTVVSFYKIFGFPDLGALIVRKESAEVLRARKYFGGGTVEMVSTSGEVWHEKKQSSLHASLEDGTLPFHNIMALQSALKVHKALYNSMEHVSRHCQFLRSQLYSSLASLRHSNGSPVTKFYVSSSQTTISQSQGPLIAFNLLDRRGGYVPKSELEKLAIVKNIQLRTGGLCNPGGISGHLELSSDEMRRNFASGQRCGDENDLFNGKPTGVVRVSLGAMSNLKDLQKFIDFVDEFYVDRTPVAIPAPPSTRKSHSPLLSSNGINILTPEPSFVIEGLSVYPIKSCAAFQIPPETRWEVSSHGLAWDREWCLVHQGTGVALSQKKYPRMALLKPQLDLERRLLTIHFDLDEPGEKKMLEIKLDAQVTPLATTRDAIGLCTVPDFKHTSATVCGSHIEVQTYTSVSIANFFTQALDVACTLARFSRVRPARSIQPRLPGTFPPLAISDRLVGLANESPILLVSRSSVNRLNEEIKLNGSRKGPTGAVGKAVPAASFRGNIVIAEELAGGQSESPHVEDYWKTLRVVPGNNPDAPEMVAEIDSDGVPDFDVLGPCQRCQMVCVDQKNAKRSQEPFSTLAKTRKREGRVWFGMHLCLIGAGPKTIKIGDRVLGSR